MNESTLEHDLLETLAAGEPNSPPTITRGFGIPWTRCVIRNFLKAYGNDGNAPWNRDSQA